VKALTEVHFCMKRGSTPYKKYTSVNTFQFDKITKMHSILIKLTFFTLLKTIEHIIICFNIPHFQLLLGVVLLVFITFENSSRKCA